MSYQEFIAKKRRRAQLYGFEPIVSNPHLMDWQARIVDWAVRRGRAALFEGTGLGKTLQQLVWGENVVKHSGPVLLVCPLGVRQQTMEEAAKFEIGCDVRVAAEPRDCGDGISITNYDRAHKFDASKFAGVILDESSILKNIDGKTRKMLCEMFSSTRYKLAATATPSPNDHAELGSHAEFLGVMKAPDMLNQFFFHDSGDTGKWTLMPHATKEFWAWVASWAVCIGMPSDIGGSDDGFVLPELRTQRHLVEANEEFVPTGYLFNLSGVAATSVHQEKRMTVDARISKAIEIIRSEPGRKCVVWCDTNQEQDMLEEKLGQSCVSIRGATDSDKKEELERQWRLGEVPVLVTKGSIFGAGMNWQHCSKMVFVGLTYSFEQYFQSVRRCWRFGQKLPVDVHVVVAETETAMQSAVARKESDFYAMREGMAEAMRERTLEEFGLDKPKVEYKPTVAMPIPEWFSKEVYQDAMSGR